MAKKPTIYDVARKANVAISTVSRVINASPYVSKETKDRVQVAIDELDFRPQVNARKLARREAQIIAVAIPAFTTPFFNEILKGIKEELKETDLDFIIYNTGSDNSQQMLKLFLNRGIPDAMLIISIAIDEELHKRLISSQIPVVLIGSRHEDLNYFYWDNFKGGYIAGEHLIRQGYKKIGMVRSHSKSEVANTREKGFREALQKYNLPLSEDFLVRGISRKHSGYSEEAGYEAIQIMQERGGLPEAIFCTNDAQAIGVMHALSELGKRIPDDVAVMGYDNIKTARFLGLSTIDQQMYDIGSRGVKHLTHIIKTRNAHREQQVIQPKIVVRKSTSRSR